MAATEDVAPHWLFLMCAKVKRKLEIFHQMTHSLNTCSDTLYLLIKNKASVVFFHMSESIQQEPIDFVRERNVRLRPGAV